MNREMYYRRVDWEYKNRLEEGLVSDNTIAYSEEELKRKLAESRKRREEHLQELSKND